MPRIEHHEVTKHPILKNVSLKVAFSRFCNFACTYCGGSSKEQKNLYPGSMEDYRATFPDSGSLSTNLLLESLRYLHASGFETIRPTGGEPMYRKDWRDVVSKTHEIGFTGIDITTNGSLLANDIAKNNEALPEGLSLVKVSLDTLDPFEFNLISGGKGNFQDVVDGIDKVVACGVPVRLNTVVLRDNLNTEWLKSIIKFCAKHKVSAIQLLDLVYYPNSGSRETTGNYWSGQFVEFTEFRRIFNEAFPQVTFTKAEGQYGVNFWTATVIEDNSVVKVNFKDSTETMRDDGCGKCSTFCQEGRCLVRLGTDGNLTPCPDYQAVLPNHFNIQEAIEDGSYNNQIKDIADSFANARRVRSIDTFRSIHNIPKSRFN